ncbi:ABC transporter ATP-binding protein [Kallotenue papyrolyticum]|uniref:ABC transporter ATP-binding protein n=1 Tax=Kallotenue papyrolyticum TaxID=1325125 RepID=UPI0004785411|nr:ABC transporter ATP-binding protein [Kallotenue papyrolyticum]
MSVIEFERVSKKFTLHREKRNTLQERMVNLFRPRGAGETFWALRDVSFSVAPGETLGLIGHNGSGKSTTLKLITRILEPTSGRVRVRGRISALLELGSGFHPDLTGRDNIFLNGSLLGFSRADMQRRIDEIIDFAELGPFIDTPVKHYSSGMYMRLGFAIATAVEPDILITDEVLAVGDEAFQRKCMQRIYQFRQEGRTILFVSHSLDAIRNLCTSALWLHHGELRAAGSTVATIDAYLRWANQQERARLEHERQAQAGGEAPAEEPRDEGAALSNKRWGSREIEITGVELLDSRGQPASVVGTGERLTIRIHYQAHQPIVEPVFGLALYHASGFQINGPNTRFGGLAFGTVRGCGHVDYTIEELPLLAGTYTITAAIYDSSMTQAYDHQHQMYTLTVQTASIAERWGSVYIPARWSWTGA